MGESRVVELTIISAQHLKNPSLFGKLHTYAVAWIDPSAKHKTHVDEEGGHNPVWNEKFRLLLEPGLLLQPTSGITIEIHTHGTFADSLLGSVRVPLTEISEEARSGGKSSPQFLAFQLHKPSGSSGTTQGLLNISLYLEPQAKPQMYTSNPSGAAYPPDNASIPSAPAARVAYPENPPSYAFPYPASEHQPVYPNQPQGYPPQQAYYPQQSGQYPYPTQAPGYPQQPGQYPYPAQAPGSQQPGQYPYPTQAPGYPQQPGQYPYPTQAPGYPHPGAGYPSNPGGNPPTSYFMPPESAQAPSGYPYTGGNPPTSYFVPPGSAQAPPSYPYAGGNPTTSSFMPQGSAQSGRAGGGGLGLAAGLAGGAVGGLLLGGLVSDFAEHEEEKKQEEELRDEVDYLEENGGYGDGGYGDDGDGGYGDDF